MAIQIKKAVRERVFLKLVVGGPSGGGKTFGAIGVAKGLAPTGKVGVIDTENRSASYYASKWDFDVIELEAPFTTQKYLEALNAFIAEGYEVVVIDSLTHEWAASGGILDQKASKDARGGNSFSNWNEMKQLHNKFVEVLLQSKIHVVCTLRSKMEYALEQDEKGKSSVRKIGLAPISSDGMEYEFGVMFDVDRNSHLAIASKDRTGLFEGRSLNLDEAVGRELAGWLASGAELATATNTTTAPATAPQASASPVAKVEPRATTSRAPMGAAQPVAQGAKAPTSQPAPARPTTAPAAVSTGATSSIPPTQTAPSEPPPAWVEAMADLAATTVGMEEKTRSKLIATWEAEGPEHLEELQAEIATIRSAMAPKTVGAAIAQMPQKEKAPVSQQASDFVDDMDPDTDEANGGINRDQYDALNTYIGAYGINRDALRAYCFKAGHLLNGANGPTLARMKASYFTTLREDLCNTKIATGTETWSQRRIRLINSTPTTFQPLPAAS